MFLEYSMVKRILQEIGLGLQMLFENNESLKSTTC